MYSTYLPSSLYHRYDAVFSSIMRSLCRTTVIGTNEVEQILTACLLVQYEYVCMYVCNKGDLFSYLLSTV